MTDISLHNSNSTQVFEDLSMSKSPSQKLLVSTRSRDAFSKGEILDEATMEILGDPKMMAMLRQADADVKAGRLVDGDELRKSL